MRENNNCFKQFYSDNMNKENQYTEHFANVTALLLHWKSLTKGSLFGMTKHV